MNALFITGTGTGVGKTRVAAGILRYLRARGIDAVPMKPLQTGAHRAGEVLRAPDLEYVLEQGGLSPAPDMLRLMAPYVYEPACSPHLAARLAGHAPKIDTIRDCVETLLERHEFLVIEGAGGLLVPLTQTLTMRDLIAALGFPVLLVAQAGLGTLNHTLLTIEALRPTGVELAGLVLNEPEAPGETFIREDNAAYLSAHAPLWGTIQYGVGVEEALGPALERFVQDNEIGSSR